MCNIQANITTISCSMCLGLSLSPNISKSMLLLHIPAELDWTHFQDFKNPHNICLHFSVRDIVHITQAFACEMSDLLYSFVAQACFPSRPARPNSCAHKSTFLGTPFLITSDVWLVDAHTKCPCSHNHLHLAGLPFNMGFMPA